MAREPSGRVVFVGRRKLEETVAVELIEERSSRPRARHAGRRAARSAPTALSRAGGGLRGCDWQHLLARRPATPAHPACHRGPARAGGIADPAAEAGPDLAATRLRTSVRGTTDGEGRFWPVVAAPGPGDAVESLPGRPSAGRRGHRRRLASVRPARGHDPGRRPDRGAARRRRRGPGGGPRPSGVQVVGEAQLEGGLRAWKPEEAAAAAGASRPGRSSRPAPRALRRWWPWSGTSSPPTRFGGRPPCGPCRGRRFFAAGTVGAGRRVTASSVAQRRSPTPANLADVDARLIKVASAGVLRRRHRGGRIPPGPASGPTGSGPSRDPAWARCSSAVTRARRARRPPARRRLPPCRQRRAGTCSATPGRWRSSPCSSVPPLADGPCLRRPCPHRHPPAARLP